MESSLSVLNLVFRMKPEFHLSMLPRMVAWARREISRLGVLADGEEFWR